MISLVKRGTLILGLLLLVHTASGDVFNLVLRVSNISHEYYTGTGNIKATIEFDEDQCSLVVVHQEAEPTSYYCSVKPTLNYRYNVEVSTSVLQTIVYKEMNPDFASSVVWGNAPFQVASFHSGMYSVPDVSKLPTVRLTPNSKAVEGHYTNSSEFYFLFEKP